MSVCEMKGMILSQGIVGEGRKEGQDSFQCETMERREEEERLETAKALDRSHAGLLIKLSETNTTQSGIYTASMCLG